MSGMYVNFAGNCTGLICRNPILQAWGQLHPTADELSKGPWVYIDHEHHAHKFGAASSLYAPEANLLQAQGSEILQGLLICHCPLHSQPSADLDWSTPLSSSLFKLNKFKNRDKTPTHLLLCAGNSICPKCLFSSRAIINRKWSTVFPIFTTLILGSIFWIISIFLSRCGFRNPRSWERLGRYVISLKDQNHNAFLIKIRWKAHKTMRSFCICLT